MSHPEFQTVKSRQILGFFCWNTWKILLILLVIPYQYKMNAACSKTWGVGNRLSRQLYEVVHIGQRSIQTPTCAKSYLWQGLFHRNFGCYLIHHTGVDSEEEQETENFIVNITDLHPSQLGSWGCVFVISNFLRKSKMMLRKISSWKIPYTNSF